ncbi:hypothetical protein [Sediminitomix flava]|uniref:Tetratricopeptide repeat protein n=1 Tax=Sediminitomix flava TaxID=379075 RepID=A0A315Z5C8_SEDFL|nr:hypothetical protein [Sediminitomix flava]PWJ38025.1 hypothetical protein BC781_108160 [Sediminitomix flava]
METDNYKKDIQLYFLKQEVTDIRSKMKSSNGSQRHLISYISVAVTLFIASMLFIYNIDNQYLINEEIEFGTFRQTENSTISNQLENAHAYILKQEYAKAIELLEQEQDSDYKDWFLLKSFVGLQNYQLASPYYDRILEDHEHIYHSKIGLKYQAWFKILRIKSRF